MAGDIDRDVFSMDRVFGPDGLLAERLPGYEYREEQLVMSRAVCRSLKNGVPLLAEAGTGTGKSLAYLIPLILWTLKNHGRALISTHTKTLQHQLIEKDLPFLQTHLGLEFRFALCLGGENYLCRARLSQLENREGPDYELLKGMESWRPKLLGWARKTKTGIVGEIDFALPDNVWRAVCRQSESCSGTNCPMMDLCFFHRAKARQRQAQVLVANHHLFFANVATGYNLLPEYQAVVFDEAHTLEDIAAEYFGENVSRLQSEFFSMAMYTPKGKRGFLNRHTQILADAWNDLVDLHEQSRGALRDFFDFAEHRIPASNNRIRYREPLGQSGRYLEPLRKLVALFERHFPAPANGEKDEGAVLMSKAGAILHGLETCIEMKREEGVYWIERTPPKESWFEPDVSMRFVPLNVADLMQQAIYERTGPVILVSATLSDGTSFAFVRERLGVPEGLEVILQSPFNYSENVGLFVDKNAPEPRNQAEFEAYLIETVPAILKQVPGGSFVLFTSLRLMDRIFDALEVRRAAGEPLPELLKQGDYPKEEILRRFKESGRAVLFGSNTFWQGVDVPGQALSCVILTRLPFAVPDDPVCEARGEVVEAQGRSPFFEFHVPNAVMMFRQGFGRLIRKHDDRGVIAVLDSRMATKGYGKAFWKAVPKCGEIREVGEIGEFFGVCRNVKDIEDESPAIGG